MPTKFSADLIAPCGQNCGVCKAYLAYSKKVPSKRGEVAQCSGCRAREKTCAFIKRDCDKLRNKKVQFCHECSSMPCTRLVHLDEHYRQLYGLSLVENLKELKTKGMDDFLKSQYAKYKCPTCGEVVSVQDGKCYGCGYTAKKTPQIAP